MKMNNMFAYSMRYAFSGKKKKSQLILELPAEY